MDIKRKMLFVIDKKINAIPESADYILNISTYDIKDKRVLDYATDFRKILEETKQTYLEFIYQFSQKSDFLKRKILDVSLWWFSEIQHKDSWCDSFLNDLAIISLIRYIKKELKIDCVEFHSDNNFFRLYCGLRPLKKRYYAVSYFMSRTKLFLKTLWVKFKIKTIEQNQIISHLFFSFFPGHWDMHNEIFSDRFFRNLPSEIENSYYAIYIEKRDGAILKDIPKDSLIVQSYVNMRFLLRQFLNFGHYFWYLRNRRKLRKLCNYNNFDLWPVFRKYILQTVLSNDFFYSILIQGLKNIIEVFKPRNLISPGEFGLEAKAMAAACWGSQVQSIWYQHGAFSTDSLWFLNHPNEVADSMDKDTYKRHQNSSEEFMPLPDKMLVWSELYKKFLSRYAYYPESRCQVVESVKYSDFVKYTNLQVEDKNQKKKFFFAPTVLEKEVRQFCYFISELCRSKILKQEQVILKLHPASYSFFNVEKILSEYKNINKIDIISKESGLENYIDTILCIIVGRTTLGIEAAFFKLPVIQYLPKYELNWGSLDTALATCFSDIDSLKAVIENLDKVKPIDYRLFFLEPRPSNERFINALENNF